LEQRVKEGVFREDLFHRLNVIRLRLPALRERQEDVSMLTRYFLQQSARQLGVEPKRISEPALQLLTAFEFPGNVRQLENICHWLTVMAPAQVIESKDLPPEVLQPLAGGVVPATPITSTTAIVSITPPETPSSEPSLSAPVLAAASEPNDWLTGLGAEALALLKAGRDDVWDVLTRKFETQLILAAMSQTRGRRIDAAQRLGIGRNTITRKIQELGLE